MRVGISTPGVMCLPEVSSPWETDATAADIADIASAADELGFDHLTCAEHVAVDLASAEGRGLTYWDPLATLAFIAARTRRIRLATAVLVLGYHHPLEIAKRYGTLDMLSGGRVVLGVGVGSLAEEFAMLGADFEGRGERAEEMIAALRASLSVERPRFHGRFYDYDAVAVRPCAIQQHVPVWVGGRTLRSLRRAVRLADGWIPFGLRTDEFAGLLDGVDLPPGFEVVLPTGRAVDPGGDPQGTAERLCRLRHAGATAVTATISARSARHYCEQLAALRQIADDPEGHRV